MKMILKELLVCLLLGMFLPGAVLNMGKQLMENKDIFPEETAKETASPMAEPLRGNPKIPVLYTDGTVRQEDLEEYLVGVVLAEMPADFEGEALKAQAVAARTYACKTHLNGSKHEQGAVCMDAGCCQAHISEYTYLQNGGSQLGIEKVHIKTIR